MSRVSTKTNVDVEVKVERRVAIARILEDVAGFLRLESLKPYIQKGIRENAFLQTISIRCVQYNEDTDEREVRRQLRFRIDWEKHELFLTQGKTHVEFTAYGSPIKQYAGELVTALQGLIEYRNRYDLELTWAIGVRPEVDRDETYKKIGFEPGEPLKKAGPPRVIPISSDKVAELSAEYTMYGDDPDQPVSSATMEGVVVKVGENYGFLRPEPRLGNRDNYFLLREWPGTSPQCGQRAEFEHYINSRGQPAARKIKPVNG